MCEHGNEVILLVPVPANLSCTGEFRWAAKGVDACIAPIVDALNKAGIHTSTVVVVTVKKMEIFYYMMVES